MSKFSLMVVFKIKGYVFKVTLKGTKPPVWRRFIVPIGITFRMLSDTIQYAMEWNGGHLHEFNFKKLNLTVTCDKEALAEYRESDAFEDVFGFPFGPGDNRQYRMDNRTRIDKYVRMEHCFTYIYDFGACWEHNVRLMREVADLPMACPIIVDGCGASLPEYDCDEDEEPDDDDSPRPNRPKAGGTSSNGDNFDIAGINRRMLEEFVLKRKKEK